MEEIIKVKIYVTNEGVVYIDGIIANCEELNNAIGKYSVEMSFESKNAYDSLYEGYKEYLNNNATVAEIHDKLDFIKFVYENQRQLAKQAIGSSLEIIKSASKILGISMADTYKEIVERLKLLNHD